MWNSTCQAPPPTGGVYYYVGHGLKQLIASPLPVFSILRLGRAFGCALKRFLTSCALQREKTGPCQGWHGGHPYTTWSLAEASRSPCPAPDMWAPPDPQPGPTGPTDSLQTEQSPGCLFSVTPVPAGYLQDFWQAGLAGTGWPPLFHCRPCCLLGNSGKASPP